MFIIRADEKRFLDVSYRRALLDTLKEYKDHLFGLADLLQSDFPEDDVIWRDPYDLARWIMYIPAPKFTRRLKTATQALRRETVEAERNLQAARGSFERWLGDITKHSDVPVDYFEYVGNWDVLREKWLEEIDRYSIPPEEYQPWHEAAVHDEALSYVFATYEDNFLEGWAERVRDWYS